MRRRSATRPGHLIGTALVLSACHTGPSDSNAADAGPVRAAIPALTGAEVDRGAIDTLRTEAQRRLRGNWVVIGADYSGSLQAWSVGDGTVRVHDVPRGEEWTAELSVLSPCQLERTRADGSSTLVVTDTFVFANDGLHMSSPAIPGGLRHGDLFVVCARGHVYTYDAPTDSCDVWDQAMTLGSASPRNECSVVHAVGYDSFALRPFGGGSTTTLDIDGDALLSADPAASVARPEPSWQEAVRAAEAMKR